MTLWRREQNSPDSSIQPIGLRWTSYSRMSHKQCPMLHVVSLCAACETKGEGYCCADTDLLTRSIGSGTRSRDQRRSSPRIEVMLVTVVVDQVCTYTITIPYTNCTICGKDFEPSKCLSLSYCTCGLTGKIVSHYHRGIYLLRPIQ